MKKIKGDLSVNGIQKIRDELKAYNESLDSKCKLFFNRLSELGMQVAEKQIKLSSESDLKSCILVYNEINVDTKSKIEGILYVTSTEQVIRTWGKGGTHSAMVSPLGMIEFGAGKYAVEGHRGTFPNQQYAFQDHWYWTDINGNTHRADGIVPTRPCLTAFEEMYANMAKVAREVFG